jgi:Tfp pilus assembly protein PilF
MKKLFYVGLFLISSSIFAQNDAVTNAFLYNKDGEYDKAKTEIDRATTHEKTKDKAKTWYFRGMIYENILASKNPKFSTLAPDAGKQAYDSYNMVLSLSKKGDEFYDQSAAKIQLLWGIFLNDGIAKYQEKKYAESIMPYEMAQSIRPQDTTAFLYALYSTEALGDYEKCKTYTRKLMGLGRVSPEMYLSLSRQASKAGKKDSALAHVVEARGKYPSNKNLAMEELQLYFDAGRGNEAKSKLEEAVKMDSSNAALFAILGNMYDQEAADAKRAKAERDAAKQKALTAYRKALKIDPKNFESNFNMGVYFYNRGAEVLKKINDMDIATYQAKGKKMEAEAQNEFKQALPYFEACYQINKDDADAKKSLKNTYERLGRNADAEKLGN